MNICLECMHCDTGSLVPLCRHPDNGIDPVSGKTTAVIARTARNPLHGACGRDGRLWEPKPVPVPLVIKPAIEVYKPKRWWHFILFWRKP